MNMKTKRRVPQAYVAGSLRHSPVSWWKTYEKIGEVIEEAGMKAYIPHIHTTKAVGVTLENSILNVELDDNIRVKSYDHSVDAVKKSELIVAEVSYPSLGTGVEIGIALRLNKKIICLAKKGSNVSSMVRGAAKKGLIKMIDYDNDEEALNKLRNMLKVMGI
jgi:2'-deoxynucleoside 5'-phosphate N-hydrolase